MGRRKASFASGTPGARSRIDGPKKIAPPPAGAGGRDTLPAMFRRVLLVILVLLVARAASAAERVRVLITLRSLRAPAGRVEAIRAWRGEAARAGAAWAAELPRDAGVRSFWIAPVVAATVPADTLPELTRRDDVMEVERDESVELERPRPGRHARGAFTYGLAMLNVPRMRELFGLSGAGVRVGLIDSGIDASHPDLAGKLGGFHDLVAGHVDPYDDNGHGTHCAGTIAGGAAGGTAIGVAPEARLLVVKAFSAAGASSKEKLLAAMQWIADPDGDPATADHPCVCSCSWFGGGSRKALLEATRRWVALGVLPVFATGNAGPTPGTTWMPAGYPESFAVGATDEHDRLATFSSPGPVIWDGVPTVKPDVSAPGEDVLSARAGGGWVAMSGTSMATPHVAGVVALLNQASPGVPIALVRELLELTARDLGEPGKDNAFGAGRVDALAAVRALTARAPAAAVPR